MSYSELDQILSSVFSPASNENWKSAAAAEIDGKEPFETLIWKNHDNLEFAPYYGVEDTVSLQYLEHFALQPSTLPWAHARAWLNMPNVTVDQEKSANQVSIDHLKNGADGILFDIRKKKQVDLQALLDKIEWQYCTVSFVVGESFDLTSFYNFLQKKNDLPKLNGALFWETLPKNTEVKNFGDGSFLFRPFGVIIPPSTPVLEITTALMEGVKLVENADALSAASGNIFNSISFSLEAGNNFFETVSKLKVLRMLWFQVMQAYGVKESDPSQLHIHVRSKPWTNASYHPHENMLKATSAAMAAVFGGCDALTVFPENEKNTMQNRIARNVSNILREESFLDRVADPLAGSYALEVMTDRLAKHAWKQFQKEVSK